MNQGSQPRPRVLLDGAYGEANLGDNAIAYCMTQFLIRNGIDVTISCNFPEYISESIGVPSINSLNFRKMNLEILKDLSQYDAIIIGGGQQLQEYRIPNPFIGMFARVCQMARRARKYNVPLVAWSVGMDWPLSFLARMMARRYLGHSNATLIFRDGKSFERARLLFEGKDCRIARSTDAVFMLPALMDKRSAADRQRFEGCAEKRLLVCVSAIDVFPGALGRLVDICKEAAQEGYTVLGWHSEIRENYDVKVRAMADWNSIPGFRWLPPDPLNTDEVADLIGSSSLVITTRMHPAIIAVSQGIATYGIATNSKMETVFDELTLPYAHAGELIGLTFSDILGCDFAPSFAMAVAFGQEAERGGRQVLEALRSVYPPSA